MHPEAMDYIARHRSNEPLWVLDVGGRDINGSPRHLFPNAAYTAIDLHDGPGVDVVGDFVGWDPPYPFDLIICAEVFEHTASWPKILERAHAALAPGGRVVITCAGPGRSAHSAIDGEFRLHPGEHYANLTADDLAAGMAAAGFESVETEVQGLDVRGTATAKADIAVCVVEETPWP